jgi:hypothetical protein
MTREVTMGQADGSTQAEQGTGTRPRQDAEPKTTGAEGAPDALEAAAKGVEQAKQITDAEEQEALDFLLSPHGPVEHSVPVTLLTPAGKKTIRWRIRQMDGKRILALEDEHTDENTGKMDDIGVWAALVAEATVFPDVTSVQFRTPPPLEPGAAPSAPDASPADSLRRVFRFETGLLQGIASQVRTISGWSVDRVGTAQRVLVDAAGNS